MILVTFAVPFESAAFRRDSASRRVKILHTGVGADAAREALEQALCEGIPERVIASGFAGALAPDLVVGEIVRENGRRFACAREVLATAEAKRIFRAKTGADVVDMETAAIQEVCAVAGVPVTVLRVISDEAGDDLGLPPEFLEDLARRPVKTMPRLFGMLVANAERRQAFLRFIRDCRTAQQALGRALSRELDPQSQPK